MRYSPFFGFKTKKSSHPAGSAKQGGYREMLKFSISLQTARNSVGVKLSIAVVSGIGQRY